LLSFNASSNDYSSISFDLSFSIDRYFSSSTLLKQNSTTEFLLSMFEVTNTDWSAADMMDYSRKGCCCSI